MTISPPDLLWGDDGTPRSGRFGDIYFAPGDGFAESRHVFLDGIGAPAVWQGRDDFTVGETGFGTGLNFLALWDLWQRTAGPAARLHYVAVERHPMRRDDLARALTPFAELASLSAELAAAWPDPTPGFHRLRLGDGRVRLTLLMGDAALTLGQLVGRIDAWFLDGFAPARNPEMWSDNLFREVARLSMPGARLATFTVAGQVRRGLAAAGFVLEKAPGFGGKRECLRGRYEGNAAQAACDPNSWFTPAAPASGRAVAVIGGGIAGLMAARTLADLGAEVVIHEQAQPLAGASGNPAAILEPWLDLGESPGAQFARAASRHALRWYGTLPGHIYDACGVRLRSGDHARNARLAALLPAGDAEPEDDGLFFPTAGLIRTAALADYLGSGLAIRTSSSVARLERHGGRWHLLDAAGGLLGTTDAVVLAAPFAAERLGGFPLGLAARRGQLTYLPPEIGTEVTAVLSGDGYVTPVVATPVGPRHLVGATFAAADPHDPDWMLESPADHAANLAAAASLLPDAALPGPETVQGRVGLRAATNDHLPLLGGVPTPDYDAAYGGLATGRRERYAPAAYQPGLYVMTGLGARGYLTAPLLAEALAALVLGHPVPLPRPVLDALHPGRFAIRRIKRRGGQASS